MLVLGVINLLKGLDFEETALTWLTAGLLARARDAFCVDHDAITLRSAVWRVPLLGAFGLTLAGAAAWAAEGRPVGDARWPVRRAICCSGPPGRCACITSRWPRSSTASRSARCWRWPTRSSARWPAPARCRARPLASAAAALVREHGTDTLSFFKLRTDKHYLFSDDRSAFVGYRVENGVLLLSGDPVGPDAALPALLDRVAAFAEIRGLKLGAVGASERLRPQYERLGLRTIYLGDEAIIDVPRVLPAGPADPQDPPVGDAA